MFNALVGCLSHQHAEVASYAAWAVSAMCSCGNAVNQAALGNPQTFKLLARQLRSESKWSVAHAAWAMGLLCSGGMCANQDALRDAHRELQGDVFADLAILLSSENPQVMVPPNRVSEQQAMPVLDTVVVCGLSKDTRRRWQSEVCG